MTEIGYHCSHEQFAPSALLEYVRAAEAAGFTAAMCSDHFHPWSDRQGQSGFAWSWLGSALQATSLSFGTVCAPGQRYHPPMIAQAAATLAEMYPGRFWVALGSGQFLNEHITGERWPTKHERNARLLEAVEVIRALWAGETISHHGHFTVEDARLYTRPEEPPRIVGAAITAETARWVGGWADAMITIGQPLQKMQQVVDAFRTGGGEGKPLFLQAQLCYAPTREEATRAAREQWGTNIFESRVLSDLRMPGDFEALARFVHEEELRDAIRISADLAEHTDWIRSAMELGFDRILLHCVHRDQHRFLEDFGREVLPALR